MKKLLIVSILILLASLLPMDCRAGGTVTLGQSILNSNVSKSYGPTLGLYIIEPLSQRWFYQSWTGVKSGEWFSSDHGFMHRTTSRLSLGAGVGYERSNGVNNTALKLYGEFNVW